MLRAGLCPRREIEGKMKGPVRGNHSFLLENSVKPVSRHTALLLSQSLAQENSSLNDGSLVNVMTESNLKKTHHIQAFFPLIKQLYGTLDGELMGITYRPFNTKLFTGLSQNRPCGTMW